MKKVFALLLALAMTLSLAACGGSSDDGDTGGTSDASESSSASESAESAENSSTEAESDITGESSAETEVGDVANDPAVTLVYAEVNPLDSISGMTATYFKEQVESLSGGSITIDIQASGVLGSESDVLDAMLGGSTSIDLARISAFALSSYGCDKSSLLTIPYTWEDRDHWWTFANSELAEEFLNEPQENGLPVRGIFYGEEGFRHFFTVETIEGIEDLAGMKLRVSDDPIMNGMVEALGASPTVVSFTELYSALQTGVVDGAEQPIANYASNAFNEVANTLILDGHTLGAIEVIITDSGWEKLTEAQQEVLMEAGALTQAYNAEISEEKENEVLEELIADGCNVIEVEDKTAWKDACADLIAEYSADYPDLYQQLLDFAD